MATPTPMGIDIYHGDSLPASTYAADQALFAAMAFGGWPFIIHKGSQGSNNQDPKVVGRLAAAARAGCHIGVYHFMDGTPIHTQIANFTHIYMQIVAACPKGCFIRPIVDNEPRSLGLPVDVVSDTLAMSMGQFMHGLFKVYPLIYGDASEFAGYPNCNWLGSCPRWLAKYGSYATSSEWGAYWSSGQWQQFSDGKTNVMDINIPRLGVGGYDMNAFSGNLTDAVLTWNM